MGIIKAVDLAFEYIRRDEEGNVEGITRAVDGVNLDIKAGDFVAILGHNGSGKSTLAKHLNALLYPTEGTVFVDGKDVKEPENVWDVRQTAGMVFQNPDNQIVATIVEEDVAFGPENIGVPSAEIRERVDRALDSVGMREFAKHEPHRLSGGQKQRVAIAGIIAMMPDCMIFDESTAMLDPIGRTEVLSVMEKLVREHGITVINITHHMSEAVRADRIIVIDRGNVIADASPREIFSNAELVKRAGLELPQSAELILSLSNAGVTFDKMPITAEEAAQAVLNVIK